MAHTNFEHVVRFDKYWGNHIESDREPIGLIYLFMDLRSSVVTLLSCLSIVSLNSISGNKNTGDTGVMKEIH